MKLPLAIALFAAATAAAKPRTFLEQHCFECHDMGN